MKFLVLNLLKKNQWRQCLKILPLNQQDIYFTPEYYELYEKNEDGQARCFVFEKDDDIALYPFLINSVNDLGYDLDDEYFDIQGAYGYNGVVTSCNLDSFQKKFYSAFDNYCKKNNIIAEFTRFHPILNNHQFTKNYMNIIYDRKTVFLNLNRDYENIWKLQYSSNNRNMIRKGRKSLYKQISQAREDLGKFESIYIYTMKKINADKYYHFSSDYFENIVNNNNTYILNVFEKKTDHLLGSMLLIIYKTYAHYHLSGRAKKCTNNAVNNYMLDEAIKFSREKGCRLFHLGGGNTKSNNDGLLRFKENFSKEKNDFFIGKKIHDLRIYNEIINKWKQRYPEKEEKYKKLLLKYRY